MTTIFSPAKVNLTLHVTGQRADGYHLLDSLVCFPNIGDQLRFSPADTMSLEILGGAELPSDRNNLVMRAADAFLDTGHQITLDKALPVSSGIGGGSANAAAVIRYALKSSEPVDLIARAANLGADVPVCIASTPQRFEGIGDVLTPVNIWPDGGYMLLVNPRVPVSTPAMFSALDSKTNPPMPAELPPFATLKALVDFIAKQRNDLQAPAIAAQPVISNVLDAIDTNQGCLITRMSGSGATCFGIFQDQADVLKAAAQIGSNHPDWWVDYGEMQVS